ncbi:hypothetical protein C479_14493 [Halovivax asiaticus JCM 14624]|uniref:Uncharacterized protein n=1 Tax=Halovivax asiaticus JCM 14624 TaxID=1227490 RepID=M0BCD1_9EURY|nr:hypothetical protein C479_14493 [Halovivax asiaticus JCM 14624]
MDPISIGRRSLTAIGVLSLCLGLAVVLFGPIVPPVPWPRDDEVVLILFFTGVLTIVCFYVPLVLVGVNRPGDSNGPPPERVVSTPTPHSRLERRLQSRWSMTLPRRTRRRIRAEIRQAAVRAIRRRSNCTSRTARETIERGDWTSDPVAESFVRSDRGSERSRVRAVVDRVRFSTRALRAVRAIVRLEREGHRR